MKKILFIGFLLRLGVILLSIGVKNYDLNSYYKVGELTTKGINIYPDVASLHHPYLPFFLYLEAIAFWLSSILSLGYNGTILIIKLFIAIFDLGCLYLIYLITSRDLDKALLYAVSPIPILIFSFHGQFDAIPLFFILLSSFYLIKAKIKKKYRDICTYLTFSIAVLSKTWPLILVTYYIKRVKRLSVAFIVIILPLLSVLAYLFVFKSDYMAITKTLIGYQGLWGVWGISKMIGPIGYKFEKISTLFFLGLFFYFTTKQQTDDFYKEIFKILLFFYVFTSNFSIQYLSWFVPFMIISGFRYVKFTTIVTSLYIALLLVDRSLNLNLLLVDLASYFCWLYFVWILVLAYRQNYIVGKS
ncbi:hypothetical protein B6D29_01925 [Microgenomates bacterium UTCPR1]|nr:MAG: hypothetical protein B6D29_01925 [Microgenomates bacterium UTCPR1]